MHPRIPFVASIAGVLAVASPARADLALNFFGDINYAVEHADTTTHTFRAAALDIFATQSEGKFSFIGEMLVEAFGSNSFEIDVDRLEVAYQAKPWLRFRAGRLRSAFGYYGDAYQNGKYFMTAVSWPLMYEGEGIDGIVPSHSIGVHGDASYELGDDRGKLTLDAEVLNGRGPGLDDVPVFEDANNHKAINLRLRYVGQGRLEGLVVGGNLYIDDLPGSADEDPALDPSPEAEHPAMHELALGGHAAYVADDIHLIAEAAWFRHRPHGSDMQYRTFAIFGEAGYQLGDITPYARYEHARSSGEDPYFASSGVEGADVDELLIGGKYVVSASVAVKLETGFDLNEDHRHFLAQAAFAF